MEIEIFYANDLNFLYFLFHTSTDFSYNYPFLEEDKIVRRI